MMTKQNRAPSTGEVTAITGYWKQYEYSACVLFRLMQDGALEAISIAEPAAGIFDDLVLHTEGRVIATQVKSKKECNLCFPRHRTEGNTHCRNGRLLAHPEGAFRDRQRAPVLLSAVNAHGTDLRL